MRVLHVYTGNLFGGVERMLLSVAALDDSDAQHTFALCFEGQLSQGLRRAGATLNVLPPARIKRPLSIWRTRAALRQLLRASSFDLVICHGIWTYCVFIPAIIAERHAPVLYLHDAPAPRAPYYRWAWLTPPKLCIANSVFVAGLAMGLKPCVPIEVIHPLVPAPPVASPERVHELRASLGAERDQVVILQASRLDAWKGHRNLISALQALREVPGWVCWIGGGPQRPDEHEYLEGLREQVATSGLRDRVRFIGHRDDMAVVLAACDVYCQANDNPEPFGMVFVEALFAGKPVVGRASGGTLDIVSADCGILCADPTGELVVALDRMIKDQGLRAQMSAKAPGRASEICGADHFKERLQAVFKTHIARRSPSDAARS